MKQQINFYRDEFVKEEDFLTIDLDKMLIAWVVAIVVSMLLYVYELDQYSKVEAQRDQLRQLQERVQTQLGSLQANFSKRGDLTSLNEQLENRRVHFNTLEAVLRQLESRSEGLTDGVAGIMQNLTELKLKSTWLTEISVYQGQLSVVGETRDPKQVPVLIQQLESLEGISDRRFARVEIMYDKDRDLHVFSIQSIDFVAPDSVAGVN